MALPSRGGGGSIVNVGSILAYRVPAPCRVRPMARRRQVLALTGQLAVEGARDGIRVNSVTPGVIRTPATVELLNDPEAGPAVTSSIPLGRVGQAEEVAWAALFLASDEASYVTGAGLRVDGGSLAAAGD